MWNAGFDYWNSDSFFLHARAHRALNALMEDDLLERSLPPSSVIFRAFEMLPPATVRVVILGQDPYPNAADAMGLAFASPAPKLPASLRNIFKELAADLNLPLRQSGNLADWVNQGVLLANTSLTVLPDGKSHFSYWAEFTRSWIAALAGHHPIVWILWGKHAQSWRSTITDAGHSHGIGHALIESPHPSPLSAHRGFFGSRPFSRANQALHDLGEEGIRW